MKYVAFVAYTIFWQVMVWGGAGYVVFVLGHSGWWMAFALFLAGCQFQPRHFSLSEENTQ